MAGEPDQWMTHRGLAAWHRSIRFVETWSGIGPIEMNGDRHPRIVGDRYRSRRQGAR